MILGAFVNTWNTDICYQQKDTGSWYDCCISCFNIWSGFPGYHTTPLTDHWTETNFVRYYETHCDRVRALVPSDRLLEFRATDGWEPLCKFLDIQVPEGPYPRLYDSESAIERVTTIWWRLVRRLAMRMLLPGVGILALVAAMRIKS